jgi:hypothetical protein
MKRMVKRRRRKRKRTMIKLLIKINNLFLDFFPSRSLLLCFYAFLLLGSLLILHVCLCMYIIYSAVCFIDKTRCFALLLHLYF